MTSEQFSNQFDVQVSAFLSKVPFGEQAEGMLLAFDEYEKSVFLSKAQDQLTISLYAGKNSYGDSFEKTEEMRRYLANLVMDARLMPHVSASISSISKNSYFFSIKNEKPPVWYIVYEAVKLSNEEEGCMKGGTLDVVPARHDEYNRLKKNPFRGANKRRALRFDLSDGEIEIVCKYKVAEYHLRYLRKPAPIVLVDGMSVSGSEATESNPACELHEALHQQILDLAVMLALQSRGYRVNNNRE